MRPAAQFCVALACAIAGLFLAGCSPRTVDPCVGISGACIGVQIAGAGALTHIDSAIIHVHTATTDVSKSATANGSLTLPAAVAVVLAPLPASTTVDLDVIGRLGGRLLGGGHARVSLVPGQHVSVGVTLISGADEDAGAGVVGGSGGGGGDDGGVNMTCRPGFHACGDSCVDNTSINSCGTSCSPCPSDPNSMGATCDGTTCGQMCNGGYHACGGKCVSSNDANSCNQSCTPCNAPTGGTATCDGTQCGGQCNDAQHKLCPGLGCIPVGEVCNGSCPNGTHACNGVCDDNTSVNSCGSSCTPCTVPNNAVKALCNNGTCDVQCQDTYLKCNGGSGPICVPPTGCCVAADCPSPGQGTGSVACNSSNKCVVSCNNGYTQCGTQCKTITDPTSCGPQCLTCTGDPNGHGTADCDGTKCTLKCNSGFVQQGNACVACGGQGQPCCASNSCTSPWTCIASGANAGTCQEKFLNWTQLPFKYTTTFKQLWYSNGGSGKLYACGSNDGSVTYSLFSTSTPADQNSWTTPSLAIAKAGCTAVFGLDASNEVVSFTDTQHLIVNANDLGAQPISVSQIWINQNNTVFYATGSTALYFGQGGVAPSPSPTNLPFAPHAVWGNSGGWAYLSADAYISGYNYDGSLPLQNNGGPEDHYYGVWVGEKGDVYVVGGNGLAMVRGKAGGAQWLDETLPAQISKLNRLYAVWGNETTGYVYAAGEGGMILHSIIGSGAWSVEQGYTAGAATLNTIIGDSSGKNVYVGGTASTLLHGQ
jgi:hypothetical protein